MKYKRLPSHTGDTTIWEILKIDNKKPTFPYYIMRDYYYWEYCKDSLLKGVVK